MTKFLCQAGLLIAMGFGLMSCQSLPKNPHLADSIALTQKVQQLHKQSRQGRFKSDRSGYYPLSTGANAFAARSILSDMSTRSIDIQYYIWHNDEAGQLMMKDLWEAAERGVKVRFLLDDLNGSEGLDQVLLYFSSHPNITVRLANPFVYRKNRTINYIANPLRTNVRMHNKSMTFDDSISIIGGRNIGNEYLNNDKYNTFADLDVMLTGSVVHEITDSFETYWASSLSYDIETLVKPTTDDFLSVLKEDTLMEIQNSHKLSIDDKALRTYRKAVEESTIGTDLRDEKLPFRWANIRFFADDAGKLDKSITQDGLLVTKLRKAIGTPNRQLSMISSYFVPTQQGVATLQKLANSGVKINILTNSFHATDVGVVHSGYAHWRQDLLSSDISLYELKSTASTASQQTNKLWRTAHHSNTSLHAKIFAIDDNKVFIGSYNIDPRSANINTELGVVIDDESLATQLHQGLDSQDMLHIAYKLSLNPNGKIIWQTIEDGKIVTYDTEPNTTKKDRAITYTLSLLPIDWLL
ncbi:phospholipase D family protein [Moraxella nasovis]|uniref:phospholipase D family protein n=1 Tax=Moraxella nasovis TaxID=2904121 RepID=UPI001F60592F|nr:phospholipase D family protein [Moraxella nasovis]UNU73196.1 phospholipase D family protein [Moraxella nasovis]